MGGYFTGITPFRGGYCNASITGLEVTSLGVGTLDPTAGG